MNYTCGTCGHKMTVSQEQLAQSKGVVVCPNCFTSSTIMATTPARKPSATSTTSAPARKPSTASKPKTTPPRRPSSKTSGKKPPQRKQQGTNFFTRDSFFNPPTALGCLWHSAIVTVVLIIVYVIIGLLMG